MSQNSMRILVCSAGRRVGLIQCFRSAAEQLNIDLKVYASDLVPDEAAACAIADVALRMPRSDAPEYAAAVLQAVKENAIDLVVPTIDPDLKPLALAHEEFARAGARLHVSPAHVIDIVRDKGLTAEVLAAAGVPVPSTLSLDELRATPDRLNWPVFAKPSGGSASRGLQVFDRMEDVPTEFPEPMIFQNLVRGPEFTVNIFVDADGVLRTVIPHLRKSIRAGEVEKGVTRRRQDLRDIAEGIVSALPDLRGVACFQTLEDGVHGPCVIEINARFGGGYPLADHAGATFAQWLLEETIGRPCTAHDDWREGVRMMRYDSAVYVD
ncbi:ATP-grasp domain-containing protein [uncultured Roseobacter sp.]|uniref:ATP-grasp domain-containing protein n=1 Tax=uncultured Roseobacter sp. TaxID=114847 RepID=UPI00261F8CE4|nr:ATP-grasp domain-containing protein [uncultured Roseobacter sp.]